MERRESQGETHDQRKARELSTLPVQLCIAFFAWAELWKRREKSDGDVIGASGAEREGNAISCESSMLATQAIFVRFWG